jgi:microcystin-dependent protein
MSQPYVGEIRMFAGNFAPLGWMFCEGQLLPISEYETLFNLIGTTYGGDGQSTFGLPDLSGRFPIHQGTNGTTYVMGERAGVETVTLATNQIPQHAHTPAVNNALSDGTSPANKVWGTTTDGLHYTDPSAPTAMLANPNPIGFVGGSQPHSNLPPYLCVSMIIALFGIYPSQS